MVKISHIVRHRAGTVRRVLFPVKVGVSMAGVYLTLRLLTGEEALIAQHLGSRTGVAAALVGALSLGLWGRPRVRGWRRALHQRFARETYDERRILADLSYAARAVATRQQLFELFVSKIQEALGPKSVAIFVRDEAGDYPCEILSGVEGAQPSVPPTLLLARDAFVVRRLVKLSTPLTIGAGDYESWARALASATGARREARRREQEALESAGASLLFPIMMKDELVGIISLGGRTGDAPYSAENKRLLLSIAGQMAFIIENTRLAERIVEEERLRRELRMATEVQRRLFPEHAPASDWLELSGSCQPARGVGGDYYDFIQVGEQLTGVAVADVAGKGISAALLMSIVQASLRSQVALARGGSLAELVATMNQLMYESTGASSYATFFYAQHNARTKRLSYVNAGHNPPLLWRATESGDRRSGARGGVGHAPECGGALAAGVAAGCGLAAGVKEALSVADRFTELTTGGPVIGVISDCVYEQGAVEVESGDVLLAYTDGVTEAFNADGEEFGEERLKEVLAGAAHLPADELRAEIVRRVSDWRGAAPQHDDLTVAVMKVK